MTVVTFVTRSGCHLCDTARDQLEAVRHRPGVVVEERDVDADPELRAAYGDQVPVVLIDGRLHSYFRVDTQALVAALVAAENTD